MTYSDAIAIIERYDRLAEDLEQETIDRLNRQLEAAYDDFESQFLRQYEGVRRMDNLLATQRRAVLMDDLRNVLQQIHPDRREEYEQRFQNIIENAYVLGPEYADAVTQAIAPGSPMRDFANLNIEAAALQARDAADRLYRYNRNFQDQASAIIEQGLIQGWSARRTTEAFLDAGLGNLTRYAAERIVRTERASAFNDAAQRRYAQNEIEGVQWITTRGDVCPFCVARNGNVYPTGRVRVPGHPFCRCMLLPWRQEWADNGLTDQSFLDDYRSDRLAELRASGQQPNSGVTAFERAARMTSPPDTLWRPMDADVPTQRDRPPTAARSSSGASRRTDVPPIEDRPVTVTSPPVAPSLDPPSVPVSPRNEYNGVRHQNLMSAEDAARYVEGSRFGDRVWYHGTSVAGAESIANDGVDISRNGVAIYGQGFYTAGSYSMAETYARVDSPAVVEMRIRVDNPIVFADDRAAAEYFRSRGLDYRQAFGVEKAEVLMADGYDGVYVENLDYLVAFSPEQVATYKINQAEQESGEFDGY